MPNFLPPAENLQGGIDQLNLFLSTLFGGKSPRLRYGVVTLTYGGASPTATANVTHGVGSTPVAVLLTRDGNGPTTHDMWYSAVGATTFTVNITTSAGTNPAAGTTTGVSWFAIG